MRRSDSRSLGCYFPRRPAVHYLTDTIAGYCVAIATVLAIALVLDHWRQWGITRKGGDGGLAG
ncbi:MAG: hypothetical protein M3300_14640 [Actinomycetota bacterium]|nr:hypothetical protein [Actinomycetota bacterium]